MTTYDWIVIGGGITGSALAYELSKQGLKVLLLEKDAQAKNATFYTYGGLAYWSGKTDLAKQLGQEGIELHRNLVEELGAETGFRELDLLLTVPADHDLAKLAPNYSQFTVKPEILDTQEACNLEPLLNAEAIAGAFKFPYAQVNGQQIVLAYQQAFARLGGEIIYEQVTGFIRDQDTIQGVKTVGNEYHAAKTVVCAGGLTNALLRSAGMNSKTYFTHALVIKTPPIDQQLRSIIMPAVQQRFALEATAKDLEQDSAWEKPNSQVVQSILDAGVAQQSDRSLYLGQISALITDPNPVLDPQVAEQQIRAAIATILPDLATVPGSCHHCLVAFNNENIANVGNLKNIKGIYLFSGFTSTMIFAPPLAKHFASWALGVKSPIIEQFF